MFLNYQKDVTAKNKKRSVCELSHKGHFVYLKTGTFEQELSHDTNATCICSLLTDVIA